MKAPTSGDLQTANQAVEKIGEYDFGCQTKYSTAAQ